MILITLSVRQNCTIFSNVPQVMIERKELTAVGFLITVLVSPTGTLILHSFKPNAL